MLRIAAVAVLVACSGNASRDVANHGTTPPPPPPPPAPLTTSPGPLAKSHEAMDLPGGCNACHRNNTVAIDANLCLGCHEHADLRARITTGQGFHASALVRGRPCEQCHRDHKGRGHDLSGWKSIKGGMRGFDHALAGFPLAGKHAQLVCDRCHAMKNQQGLRTFLGTPRACFACHSKDQPHQLATARAAACERCHTAAGWTPPRAQLAFRHDDRQDARFPLGATHARVACTKCHANKVFASGYVDPDACERCHTTSPHGTRFAALGPACNTCHRASWRATGFAHGRNTKFPLHSGHDRAACRDCHRGTKPDDFERLTGASATCGGCHRHPATAVHDGKYTNAQCLQCHRSPSLPPPAPARLSLMHGPKGTFPLVAGHKLVPCADCHPKRNAQGRTVFQPLSRECSGCHVDSHRGARGPRCVTCHEPGTWTARAKSGP